MFKFLKCMLLNAIGPLQLMVTWYKIHLAGVRASYTLGHPKQRTFKFDWMMSLCFGCPNLH